MVTTTNVTINQYFHELRSFAYLYNCLCNNLRYYIQPLRWSWWSLIWNTSICWWHWWRHFSSLFHWINWYLLLAFQVFAFLSETVTSFIQEIIIFSTVSLTKTGDLYSFGQDKWGQCGIGRVDDSYRTICFSTVFMDCLSFYLYNLESNVFRVLDLYFKLTISRKYIKRLRIRPFESAFRAREKCWCWIKSLYCTFWM